MKDLELKYHSETGTHATEEFVHKSNLTDGYIEWLEDLAEKYLKQQKINTDANKVMAKFENIKLAFENLKDEIGFIEDGDIMSTFQYSALNDTCDQLESEIND